LGTVLVVEGLVGHGSRSHWRGGLLFRSWLDQKALGRFRLIAEMMPQDIGGKVCGLGQLKSNFCQPQRTLDLLVG
jgi:hypothetical protein